MRLYLLRHGPAAQPDLATQDASRPLTQAGMELMTQAMQHHVQHLPKIHHVWCSPYLRARQTAHILAEALHRRDVQGGEPRSVLEPMERDDLTPGSRPGAVLEAVQVEAWEDPDEALVLVAHEPLLGRLLGLLIAGVEPFSVPLSPGMLAGVELAEPRTMTGRLVFCMAAEDAAQLTGSLGHG